MKIPYLSGLRVSGQVELKNLIELSGATKYLTIDANNNVHWSAGSSNGNTVDLSNYFTKSQSDSRFYPLNSNPNNYLTTVDWSIVTNKPSFFDGNYNSLINKPTLLSQFSNDVGYITDYSETDTLDSVLGRGNTSNKNINVSGKATFNGQLIIPSSVSTDANSIWIGNANSTGNTSPVIGFLNDLQDVTITLPSSGQALVFNGSQWVNQSIVTSLGDYYNKSQSDAKYALIGSIPTNVSQLTNDSGYVTASIINGYATQVYVNNSIANLVASAPSTLDTLNELALALGNDANFSTTVTNLIGTKANSADVYSKGASDGRFQPLENQRLSTGNNVVFNKITTVNELIIPSTSSVNSNSIWIGNSNSTGNNAPSIAFLNDLGDVNITLPSSGQALVYNSTTSKWINQNVITDLSGYYTKSESDSRFKGINYVPTWAEVTGKPTNLSQFTNDLGNYGNWITASALSGYATEGWVNGNFYNAGISDARYHPLENQRLSTNNDVEFKTLSISDTYGRFLFQSINAGGGYNAMHSQGAGGVGYTGLIIYGREVVFYNPSVGEYIDVTARTFTGSLNGNANTSNNATNSTLWNGFSYSHTDSAVDTYLMAYKGGGVYGLSSASNIRTFLNTDGLYQPLENQRLSTSNNVEFNKITASNVLIIPSASSTSNQSIWLGSANSNGNTPPSTVTTLASLQDVNFSLLQNGQSIIYNSTTGKWQNTTFAAAGNYANADGSNASGTWNIGITGNATTSTNASNATLWNGMSFVGDEQPVNAYIMTFGADGKWHYGTASQVKSWLGLNASFHYYNTFTADANTVPENTSNFTYALNAPYTGALQYFGATNYGMQINSNYQNGNRIAFRTRNGDVNTWNPWYNLVLEDGFANAWDINIDGNATTSTYASNAGNATNWAGFSYDGAVTSPQLLLAYNGTGWGYSTAANVQSFLGLGASAFTAETLQSVRNRGRYIFSTTNATTSYSEAAFEIRETNLGASGDYLPPRMAFHWAGVVASQISIESSGRIAIRNNPGDDYENFRARVIEGQRIVAGYDSGVIGSVSVSNSLRVSGNGGIAWDSNSVILENPNASTVRLHTASSSTVLLDFWSNGTRRGYVAGNSSNDIGFLNNNGDWTLRVDGISRYIYGTSFMADSWFRSTGATGWYSETYGGGIYMEDSTWVRVYAGKGLLVQNTVQAVDFISQTNGYNVGDFGIGLVGIYSPSRYQGIFSMGATYRPSQDGTSLANSYGIVWTYEGMGQAKTGLGHQMLVTEAGVTQTAIGNGIWTRAGIYAGSSVNTDGELYVNNYIRSKQLGVGLYNEVTATHFNSNSDNGYRLISGSNLATQLQMVYANGTSLGYLYGDGGGFGLLNDQGGWSIRVNQGSGFGGWLFGNWNVNGSVTASGKVKSEVEVEAPVVKATTAMILPTISSAINGAIWIA